MSDIGLPNRMVAVIADSGEPIELSLSRVSRHSRRPSHRRGRGRSTCIFRKRSTWESARGPARVNSARTKRREIWKPVDPAAAGEVAQVREPPKVCAFARGITSLPGHVTRVSREELEHFRVDSSRRDELRSSRLRARGRFGISLRRFQFSPSLGCGPSNLIEQVNPRTKCQLIRCPLASAHAAGNFVFLLGMGRSWRY